MGYSTDENTGTAHGHVLMSPAERLRIRRLRRRRPRSERRCDWHPEAGRDFGTNRADHRRHAMESRRDGNS